MPGVDWLLASDEPAIRGMARRDLSGQPANEDLSRTTEGPLVRALFAGQLADGAFGGHPYKKWAGAHWRHVSLVELEVPAGEPRAVAAADRVLRWLTSPANRAPVRRVKGLPLSDASIQEQLGGDRLAVTRQEVVNLAPPTGDDRFDAGRLPIWVDYRSAVYGLPSIEGRGIKVAPDRPGPSIDPDAEDRRLSDEALAEVRTFLARRMPEMADRPVAEGRGCQYESMPDAHFVIDRNPGWDNAWLVGDGSGHAFKRGPAIDEYAAALAVGDGAAADRLGPGDGRFALGERRGTATGLRTSAAGPSRSAGEPMAR